MIIYCHICKICKHSGKRKKTTYRKHNIMKYAIVVESHCYSLDCCDSKNEKNASHTNDGNREQ